MFRRKKFVFNGYCEIIERANTLNYGQETSQTLKFKWFVFNFLRVDKVLKRTFGHKKSSLIMDKEQSKCFHNGIILIVNCFRFQR